MGSGPCAGGVREIDGAKVLQTVDRGKESLRAHVTSGKMFVVRIGYTFR
jgi:hypothetical protein